MNIKKSFLIFIFSLVFIPMFATFDQYPTININGNRIIFVKVEKFTIGKDDRMVEFGYSILTPKLKVITSNYYFSSEIHDSIDQITSDIIKDVLSLHQPCIIKVNSRCKWSINQDLIDLILMWEKW